MPSMRPGSGIRPPSGPATRKGPAPKLPATTCASSWPSTGCGYGAAAGTLLAARAWRCTCCDAPISRPFSASSRTGRRGSRSGPRDPEVALDLRRRARRSRGAKSARRASSTRPRVRRRRSACRRAADRARVDRARSCSSDRAPGRSRRVREAGAERRREPRERKPGATAASASEALVRARSRCSSTSAAPSSVAADPTR